MPAPFTTRVLLRSEQTGDQVALVENTLPPGTAGPPLHHHDFDEAFHVLEGELTFQVGDELTAAAAGSLVFVPRGIHHTLANPNDAPARYLLVITPGGFERHFDKIAAEQAGVDPPETAAKPYPETIVVGPPLSGEATSRAPVPSGDIKVMLRGEDSGGVVSVMDNVVPAGMKGPFLHEHGFDEAFYVAGGELTFQVEDELITVPTGEVAFAPRNVAHTYTNRDGGEARFVLVCTPPGFERYFARMAAKRAVEDPPGWAQGPIPEVTRVGPQIGETD